MELIRIEGALTFTLTPNPGVTLTDETANRIKEFVKGAVKAAGIGLGWHATNGPAGFTITCKLPEIFPMTAELAEFAQQVLNELKVFCAFGTDADILRKVLEQHPALKDNANFPQVLGAFENLARIIKEVEADPKGNRKLPNQPQLTAGTSVPAAVDREEHHRKGMLGQLAEQTPPQAAPIRAPSPHLRFEPEAQKTLGGSKQYVDRKES